MKFKFEFKVFVGRYVVVSAMILMKQHLSHKESVVSIISSIQQNSFNNDRSVNDKERISDLYRWMDRVFEYLQLDCNGFLIDGW
jgi:hypothetical protein